MKRRRRWREKNLDLFIASCHKNARIHDFLKGWGTICKDGSILWNHYKPATKKQIAKALSRKILTDNFKAIFPMINAALPEISVSDIIGVQPMR